MYVPAHFKEERVAVLHDAIRTYGFGTLVTSSEQELEASHLPLLLDPEPAPLGTVLGHLARANPQWTRVKPGVAAQTTGTLPIPSRRAFTRSTTVGSVLAPGEISTRGIR